MTDSAEHFDVAVVGCGTTGLTLAHLLARADVRVAVIDRGRLPVSFPRATHLDDETMRAFQTLGVAHMEPRYIGVGTYRFLDPRGTVVMEFNMNRGLTDQGWNSDYMFHQPDWESVLRGSSRKPVQPPRTTGGSCSTSMTTTVPRGFSCVTFIGS